MNPTPYPDLNTVLQTLVDSIQSILGDNMIGIYLQGSFAVGDFDVHSDVDFIVVLEEELTGSDVDALQQMQEHIYGMDIPWAQHLEGSYFPQDVLRDYTRAGSNVWYFDHGSIVPEQSNHCNTIVVRWTVREFGVTLAGPPPDTLIDPIPVEALRRDILATLTGWGREILDAPEHYSNRFYQAFITLNYCRMLHDLHMGAPSSKRTSAEWAKKTLNPSWIGLIDRAWTGRPDPATSVRTPADPKEYALTLKFVEYIIDEALQYAADNNMA